MSYTYQTWLSALATMIVVDPNDVDFLSAVPSCIDYAENRIYAELDLLNTVTRDMAQLMIGNRNFTLPKNIGQFVVTNGFNLIVPSSVTDPEAGTRIRLVPISRDYLDMVGGGPGFAGAPENFPMITDQSIIVGPMRPDAQ